jgi:hypothetical protein
MLKINLGWCEFGYFIGDGLWLPSVLHNAGKKVRVTTRIPFPEEWILKWVDEYDLLHELPRHIEGYMNKRREFIVNYIWKDKQVYDNSLFNDEHLKPLYLPKLERPIKEKYIVLIPTVWEFMIEVNKWDKNDYRIWKESRLIHSLSLSAWVEIANRMRKKGYKVVCFGDSDGLTKEMIEKIGDINFYIAEYDRRNFLIEQLKWLQNAEMNVAFGGAFIMCAVFDHVPAIGYDGDWYKWYSPFRKGLIKNKEKKLCFLDCWNSNLYPYSVKYKDFDHILYDFGKYVIEQTENFVT